MVRVVVVLAVVLAGCLKPDAVLCGNGRTCPADRTCDEVRGYCLTAAQTTACANTPDGKPCDALGTPGICDRGFCEPGCGDGVTDPNEECDDANFASHDGCSSRCVDEVPTWLPEVSPWQGLLRPSAAYHAAMGRIVMIGGINEQRTSTAIWQYDPTRSADLDGGWRNVAAAFAPGERPSARWGAGISYDSLRNVIVLHGGVAEDGLSPETWEYAASARTFDGEPVGVWTLKTPATPALSPGTRVQPAMTFDATLGKTILYRGIQNAMTDPDTWLYDGTWTRVATTVDPLAIVRASMAYDPLRGKTVLYGALGSSFTYEFTGTNWTQLTLTPNPGARVASMMTYDPVRQRLVLFGGTVGTSLTTVASDTWTYNGVWQQVSGATNPPGRQAGVLVADPVNGRLILAGGAIAEASTPFDDIWELSSTAWERKSVRFEPAATTTAAGAYSRDDRMLVVVGGATSGSPSNFEVWGHDGSRWKQLGRAPVDRYGHGFVYDPDGRRFVMTGGVCGDVHPDDCDPAMPAIDWPVTTYALDATTLGTTSSWSLLPATWAPQLSRSAFATAYDEAAHELVVFGGFSGDAPAPGGGGMTGLNFTDTWISDGTTWTALTTTGPAASSPGLAGWDPVRAAVVLFDSAGDTWELRDHEWVQLIPASPAGPAGRRGAAMTYDPLRKRFVIVGGSDGDGMRLTDTWELDTATLTWSPVFVAGVSPLPRSSFVLAAHASARALYFYGGADGTGFAHSDTWRLQYVSTTPDEICTFDEDSVDDDGDAQADSEDPDCDPLPPQR